MNLRERFNLVMHFQEADRVPNFEIGYWKEAVERWHQEGLPRNIKNVYVGPCVPMNVDYGDITKIEENQRRSEEIRRETMFDIFFPKPRDLGLNDYFGFDRHMRTNLAPNMGPLPEPSVKIVKDEGENVVVVNGLGAKYRTRKKMGSIPQYLKFPVETMKDWKSIKTSYDASTAGRYPGYWDRLVKKAKRRDYPLCLIYNGFWAMPRALMGTPNLCKALYMDPDLVLDINEHWCDFSIEVTRKALEEVDYDCAWIGEDMAYKGRAMISPTHFRKFMLPYYKRLTRLLREHGVDVVIVDSDGYMHGLIPLLIEGGVTGTWPLEIAAGNDPMSLSKEYRKKFILLGGIDKYALALGPEAIDMELSKLPYLVEAGGYIPTIDHMIQPNVSLANMTYYTKVKKRLILDAGKK